MLVTLGIMLGLIALMIGLNALYVAGEFSAVAVRKSRVIQSARGGNRFAKSLLPIVENSHKLDNYIAASQVGITLSSLILGIYGQNEIAPLLEPALKGLGIWENEVAVAGASALLILVVLTALQVVLGELVPKSLAIQFPEKVAFTTVLPMRWSAEIFFRPLIWVLNGSGVLILRLFGATHEGEHKHVHSPEEIQYLIQQSHEGGLLDEEEREMLENAFRFGDLKVVDVIVPRVRMVASSSDSTVEKILQKAVEDDLSRIPIYETNIDNVIGFVHIKEVYKLYRADKTQTPQSILRPVSVVTENMSIQDVWETLNRDQSHIAVVGDEYGGTLGMVTREDLLEEIFGEVKDEFDEDELPEIQLIAPQQYRVRGDTSLVDVNDELDTKFATSDVHTIAGLILHHLERLPNVGDAVEVSGVRLVVEKMSDKTVETVTLILPNTPSTVEE